jgi:hypothetical protein
MTIVEDGKDKVVERNVKFERDFTGTCWETCKDAVTGENFDDCKVSIVILIL